MPHSKLTGAIRRTIGTATKTVAALSFVVVTASILPWIGGRDPALSVLRARLGEREPDAAALQSIRSELGLADNPWQGMLDWLGNLFHGDLGISWVSREPIAPLIVSGLGVSISLALLACLVCLVVAFLLCIPVMRGRDASSGYASQTLTALPEFLVASLFSYLAILNGPAWPHTGGLRNAADLVLPALALGIPLGGSIGIVLRASLGSALAEPWVMVWRSAGISQFHILLESLKRALAVSSRLLGLVLAALAGGTIGVEQVFTLPGVGRLSLQAVLAGDAPLIQASTLAVVGLGLLIGALGRIANILMLGDAFNRIAVPRAPEPKMHYLPLLMTVIALFFLVNGLLRDPYTTNLKLRLTAPSLDFPFGTDSLGRDMLARLSHGAISTVGAAMAILLLALVMGLFIGAVTRGGGYLADVSNALPNVTIGLLIAAAWGPSPMSAIIAIGLVAWIPVAAHAGTLFAEQSAASYVRAATAMGASRWRIYTRHLLPGVMGPVLSHTLSRLPGIALALAALSFLGLGEQPPSPQWGRLLADGLPYVARAPWLVLIPGGAMLVLGIIFTAIPGWYWAYARLRSQWAEGRTERSRAAAPLRALGAADNTGRNA